MTLVPLTMTGCDVVSPAMAPDLYAAADVRHVLYRGLSRLPARQRAVGLLRYVEGYGESETAALLGRGIGTVKSSASRGLAMLKAEVGPRSTPTTRLPH